MQFVNNYSQYEISRLELPNMGRVDTLFVTFYRTIYLNYI